MKKNVFYVLFFALFLYSYMTVMSLTDSFAATVEGLNESLLLHYLPAATRILGFISFAVSRKLIEEEKSRRAILMFFTALFFISSVILIIFSGGESSMVPKPLMVAALFMLSFSIGHLGGLIYYVMSMALVMHPMRGRITGAACALAIVIQMLLARFTGDVIQLITVIGLFILLAYLTVKPPADYVLEDALPFTGEDETYSHDIRYQLAMAMLATLICVIIACRIDIAFSTMSFSGDLNLYSFPRLFILPGYLIMGFVADSDDRRLFPAVFMAGVLSSVTLVAMPFYDKGYYFFLSLYYLFIGFYVFYFTYSFMALAPRTKTPELWASFGRPFSDLVSGIIIMLLLNTKLGSLPPLATSCAHFILLAAICLLMMLGRIDPALNPKKRHALSSAKDDVAPSGDEVSEERDEKVEKKHELLETEERLDAFLDKYPLTPREREVAKYLIETELTMKEIATNLYISERSAYRYSSSIYGKTGAAGRKELLRLYLEG